jgi:hypothetical protein
LPRFGGGERQLNTGVSENEVGSGKFFQSETGLAAGIAELVMGRQHHQDFHVPSPFFSLCPF